MKDTPQMAGDDMENGAYDPEARVARIAERVDNQGARITHLETVVAKGFSDIQSSFGKQFGDLSAEMRHRDRTPWGVIWPAMGVMFAILFGIGGALYWPVRETMTETKMDIRLLKADALSVAAFQDFKATYENNRLVSRNEYIDKFSQVSNRLDKIEAGYTRGQETAILRELYDAKITDLQRQIDGKPGRSRFP